jgi:hypothetical protein
MDAKETAEKLANRSGGHDWMDGLEWEAYQKNPSLAPLLPTADDLAEWQARLFLLSMKAPDTDEVHARTMETITQLQRLRVALETAKAPK